MNDNENRESQDEFFDLKQIEIEQADVEKIAHAMAYFDDIRKHLEVTNREFSQVESENSAADPTLTEKEKESPESQFAAPNLELPGKIDRFEIQAILGQGGNARVFLAHDPKLDREVALKVLRPSAVFSEESRQRFQREAHAAAILSHPNIVPVFESGVAGPFHFMVSEYCKGESLISWFEQNKQHITDADAVHIVMQIADAVQHAHTKGIIHRDLKPGNIIVKPDDDDAGTKLPSLQITDFGLAQINELESNTLTAEGAIVGTPAYMSPEQARGDNEVGRASDIFSIGVILYELLTGKLPFYGEHQIATLRLVEAADPIPPRKIVGTIARDLEAICLKALDKNPSERYTTAHAFHQDLSRWLNGFPVSALPVRTHEKIWRSIKRNPGISTALLFAFLSLALGMSLTTWKWLQADRNLLLANLETERANQLNKRTNDALEAFKLAFMSADPNQAGKPNLSAREVLETTFQHLPKSDFDDEGKMIFYDALFHSFQGVGDYQAAAQVGEKWIQSVKAVHGKNSSEVLVITSKFARLLARLSRYQESRHLLAEVLDKQIKLEPNSENRFWTQEDLQGCWDAWPD